MNLARTTALVIICALSLPAICNISIAAAEDEVVSRKSRSEVIVVRGNNRIDKSSDPDHDTELNKLFDDNSAVTISEEKAKKTEKPKRKKYTTRSQSKRERKVRLRAAVPVVEFRTSRMTTLHSVKVDVKNTSSFKAKDISVEAIAPGGKAIPLSGPATLDGYEEAVYSAMPQEPVLQHGRVRIEVTCENCYR